MRIRKAKKDRQNERRAGVEVAQTLSTVAQIALLCPSGIDVWMQRELVAGTDRRRGAGAGRR